MSSLTLQSKASAPDNGGMLDHLLLEVSHTLAQTWEHLSAREHHHEANTISLPYQTLRYMDEVERAFEMSYCVCPVNNQQKTQLKQIEIECHALQAAIHARELLVKPAEMLELKPIFIALRVLFKEFKDDRMHDGKQRFAAFVRQLHKLVNELPGIIFN
ncbi:MAG: hypothetical protein ACFHVJ_00555 [Aestuariibacter sp.]